MTDILVLDALNPPAPAQLVADMRQVGAVAVALYVLRRDASGGLLDNGTWTSGHVREVLADGRFVLPIVVPGSNPLDSDVQLALDNARALGCPVGPIVVDVETFSFPSAAWVGLFIRGVRGQGWRALRYGDVAALTGYPTGDGDWDSHGRITVVENQLFPMPALPQVAGVVGDQYTVGVLLNGTDYDGSVFARQVFSRATITGGGGMGFLSRDVGGVTLDDVYVSGGEAVWGTFPGGAGQWESWTGGQTDLGSPAGAKDLARADGAFTVDAAGNLRLNAKGVRKDGSRWIKVMNAANVAVDGVEPFGVLQDWTRAQDGPNEDVASQVAHTHAVTTSGTSGGPL